MPRLRRPGGFRKGYQVVLTTHEDLIVVERLGLWPEIDVGLSRQRAEEVLEIINRGANQLRNPPGSEGAKQS